MKATIDYHQATEVETHKFSAEASSLGLPPHTWPDFIFTAMGNGQPFRRGRQILNEDGDELIAWVYHQDLGCIQLTLFND